MNRKEIFVLNWLFASLYFPTSTLLLHFNKQGTLFGVVIVGLVFHAILTILLTITLFAKKGENKTELPIEMVEQNPKRAYKKKTKPEVKNNEEEIEPEPKMRTDINLNELDDAADGTFH